MPPTPDPSKQPSIAVIGGGAAGFFAAVNAARKNPRLKVTIFEAGQRPLQKVLISGGGRCNVTHHCFDPARLIEHYPRGQRELRSLFARFQPQDTLRWFTERGLKLKTEADGRMFPVSDCSQDVIDVLLREAQLHRVTVHTGARVDSIIRQAERFAVTSQGQTQLFDACVLATGYSPPGWRLAQALGHTILPPVPSLFPFTVKAPVIAGLQGISLSQAGGRLVVDTSSGKPFKTEAEGPLLITHTGLSGPLIYRLSAWGARALAENRYQAKLVLDLLPTLTEADLRACLNTLFHQDEAQRQTANTSFTGIPQRLWVNLLAASGASLEEKADTLSKKTLNRLIEHLKRLELPISGKSPSKEEFVSCGGVILKEVDFQTMQSKRVPGLYLGGEILDIDGLTGGFNFQACWSAGWVISEALQSL